MIMFPNAVRDRHAGFTGLLQHRQNQPQQLEDSELLHLPPTICGMFPSAFHNTKKLCKLHRQLHQSAVKVLENHHLEETVTSSFASFIPGLQPEHLPDTLRHRSKRMILDNIGVGLVGSTTQVFNIILQYCQVTRGQLYLLSM
ncbi:hypothetical protein FKM82_021684 [Ascaphus truei]